MCTGAVVEVHPRVGLIRVRVRVRPAGEHLRQCHVHLLEVIKGVMVCASKCTGHVGAKCGLPIEG